MTEWGYIVQTAPRLAQWKVEALCSCTYRESEPFKIGLWKWRIIIERNKKLYVKLYPEASSLRTEQTPISSFVIKLTYLAPNRTTITHPEVRDKQLKDNEGFVWAIDTLISGRFIIDIEFIDIKIKPKSDEEPLSIWNSNHIEKQSFAITLISLSRMLAEGIHTDITINTSNGSIGAHRAVLAARSPVFQSMFSHNLREKELSTVNISDISFDACQAFLNYIYGNFQGDEFLSYRLELLRAADKYDMLDLKEACHESLLEDIDSKNVLVRLQTAHLYHLSKLKSKCLTYLLKFGKIYEIREDFNVFLQNADRELIADITNEILSAWKGF